MSPRRIMVTGVAHPMIARLARRLAVRDDVAVVVGVDTRAPGRRGDTHFVRADLANPVLGAVLNDERIDTLVHAGIRSMPGAAGGRQALKEHNVIGTMHLMGAIQRASHLTTLVVKSSSAVYGSSHRDPALFREDDDLDRRGAGYSRDMVDVEGYAVGAARRHDTIDVTILRFANFIGGVDDAALAGLFRLPAIPTVLGWDPRLQFCHAEDAIGVLVRAATRPVPGTFNVAGPGVLYLSQAVRRAGRLRVSVPDPLVDSAAALVRRTGRVDAPIDQLDFLRHGRVMDVTRLVHEFGYVPRWTTPDAFQAFLDGRVERGPRRADLAALGGQVRDWLRKAAA